MHPRDQTIFALSSGRPPSAIAIVRVSGSQAGQVLTALADTLPKPRLAHRTLLRDVRGEPIDDAVVLWFPGPGSATGEDVAEFHVHGGRAVLAALFAAISKIPNLRAAEPGEFTRRGEAGIDFSDEGDVPEELMAPALARIRALHGEIAEVLAAQGKAERLRDGLVVAIAGPPNVGKSTLINQLARRDVAIVSPHAGTTRDVIEVQLDLDGYPVTVIDTAGIRETEDPVEQEGVRRARARAEEADLVLWLADADRHEDDRLESSTPVWLVRNKIDLAEGGLRPEALGADGPLTEGRVFAISARRGDGLAELITALVEFAVAFFGVSEVALVTRVRQRELLRQALERLQRSLDLVEDGEELVAEELRAAAFALGRLLGRVDVEDVLGAIFQKFCIGK